MKRRISMRYLAVVAASMLAVNLAEGETVDHGKITALTIETGRSKEGSFELAGRDAGQQLLIHGRHKDGYTSDLTREVRIEVAPADVAEVRADGYVVARREGEATIRVIGAGGLTAEARVRVTHQDRDLPINFSNDIVPIFTRYGCNAGGCHGKSGGQNGFALSLLGFEPQEDYEYLVKEARGRRIFPAAPEHSLLLTKAAGLVAHGGGKRIEKDSAAFRMLRRWVEQGTPYGRPDDASVSHIEIVPGEQIVDRGSSQQLVVIAHYSDGTTRDVTRLSQFEPNDKELASVSENGLVTTKSLTGKVAVMARFQAHVTAAGITVPSGVQTVKLPRPNNFVDELVFKQLKNLGLPPSELCDDSTFLRRVTIDIAGRLPTLEETKQFLDDESSKKRAKLVDRLLASDDYADFFANKWSAVLRNKRASSKHDTKPTFAFHSWIRERLKKNQPYDEFVRELLTARGKEVANPPVTWYNEVRGPEAQAEDVAQLFLGTRIQCARCHHHPFEKWSQQDYYGFAAFFAQLDYKKPPKQKKKKKKKKKRGPITRPLADIYHKRGIAQAVNPRTGEAVKPTGLGGDACEVEPEEDPREQLVDWMVDKDNPFFAKALVNRYWKHFLHRGLVDPEDDMRVTNPASNPELLERLARDFIEADFDLKHLVRTICLSRTYQLSALSKEENKSDKQNFSRYYPKRLHAEVLSDAIDQVTKSPTRFRGVEDGTRAVQLPDNAFDSYFLSVFGRPTSSSACECERSSDLNLAQLLHLLNSSDVLKKVAGKRANDLARDKRSHEEKIRELYLVALSREPQTEELGLLTSHIERKGEKQVKEAYEDIIWALINSQEFIFNH